jgi:hypothetical protein
MGVNASTWSATTTAVSEVPFSGEAAVDSLLYELKWGGALGSGATLTYSFPYTDGVDSYWQLTYSDDNEPWFYDTAAFDGQQQAAAQLALQTWANVADLNFVQVAESSLGAGEIRFTLFDAPFYFTTWGWAYLPFAGGNAAGDIWVNSNDYHDNWSVGTYNFSALMHEVGHALGLTHSFEAPIILAEAEDSYQYTLMSYTEHPFSGYIKNLSGEDWVYYDVQPQTPMLYDMAAIQYLYGANLDYRTGDDLYSFDPQEPFLLTIWDAGGIDTLSVANFTQGCLLDLRAGHFSSIMIDNSALPDYLQVEQLTYDGTDNLAIAFGVTLENALGGSGDDVLIGNQADNLLDGGEGLDTAIYEGALGDFSFSWGEAALTVSDNTGLAGTDLLLGIERLQFGDRNLAFDLNDNAGQTAKLLGAVFGAASITNQTYAGIGLELLDGGMSYEELGALAISAAGATTSQQLIELLWTNVVGSAPTPDQVQPFIDLLEGGMSSGELAVLAAETDLNQQNIDLPGLARTGLEYLSFESAA